MDYYLYILKNIKGQHYIGITHNLENRLAEHNRGEVRSTKAYKPWKAVYTETYRNKTGARKREIFLKKTAKARKELFARIDILASSSSLV